jgi:predicted metal-dependent peptidase
MNEFYPKIEDFLLEKAKLEDIPQSAKIEDYGYVFAKDGTKIDMRHLKTEMESAKTAIVSQSPLFAPYVHKFTPIYTWLVKTMATDGTRLFVNPMFANKLDWNQKIFVIIHEIMHCVLLHMDRMKSRNVTVVTSDGKPASLFNIAGDYEINDIIVDTLNDFNEEFVKKLGGLYDVKWLNIPVEVIYDELKKTIPKMPPSSFKNGNEGADKGEGQEGGGAGGPGQPGKGKGKGKGGSQPLQVGSKVKIKSSGEKGVVTAINPDGTYEVDPLNEGYKREDLVPLDSGQGQGEGGEGEGGEGEGEPGDNNGVGGAGLDGYDETLDQTGEYDPAGTGGILSKEMGKKIAKASGYGEGEMGPDENATDKWRVEGAKMLDRAEKGQKGRGQGKGESLVKALYRLHRGDVNWQNMFRRYVATALSPEVYQKIGNKKYLGGEYLRYGEKHKMDALENIVVLVDVSGSMGQEALNKILNEINQIIFSKRVNKIVVAFFDDGVDDKSVQTIKRMGKPYIPKNVKGGGGTNFQKALDWVHEHLKDRVSLLVFFTDGGAPNPKKPTYAHKFIWVVYDNPGWKQPFGKQINVS